VQLTQHVQALAVQRGELRYELNLRMVGGVEEVGGSQVLVASGIPRVEAICLDRQLNRPRRGEVERALIALEAALDRRQAPHGAGVELDVRALGVDAPARVLDVGAVSSVGRNGVHRCLLRAGWCGLTG